MFVFFIRAKLHCVLCGRFGSSIDGNNYNFTEMCLYRFGHVHHQKCVNACIEMGIGCFLCKNPLQFSGYIKKFAVAQQTSIPSVVQQKSIPSVVQQTSIPSVVQQTSIPSVVQQKSIPSVVQQTSIPPVAQQKSIPPVAQQKSIPPVVQQMPKRLKATIPQNLPPEIASQVPVDYMPQQCCKCQSILVVPLSANFIQCSVCQTQQISKRLRAIIPKNLPPETMGKLPTKHMPFQCCKCHSILVVPLSADVIQCSLCQTLQFIPIEAQEVPSTSPQEVPSTSPQAVPHVLPRVPQGFRNVRHEVSRSATSHESQHVPRVASSLVTDVSQRTSRVPESVSPLRLASRVFFAHGGSIIFRPTTETSTETVTNVGQVGSDLQQRLSSVAQPSQSSHVNSAQPIQLPKVHSTSVQTSTVHQY